MKKISFTLFNPNIVFENILKSLNFTFIFGAKIQIVLHKSKLNFKDLINLNFCANNWIIIV